MRTLFQAFAVVATAASQAQAEAISGLTNLQQLVTFDRSTRVVMSTRSLPFNITGAILVSIDVRPVSCRKQTCRRRPRKFSNYRPVTANTV
jgi:hypothetical protein